MIKIRIIFFIISSIWLSLYALAGEKTMATPSERIAYFFYQRGDLERAIEEYENITQKEPLNSKAHYNLGCLYAKFKYYYLAIKEFKKAGKTESSVKKFALYNLVVLYGKYLNDLDNAAKYYRKFKEIE